MNIYYDIESNCYRTYPDGDKANENQIKEMVKDEKISIIKLQQENKQQKEVIDKLKLENKVLKEQMIAMVKPNYTYGIR